MVDYRDRSKEELIDELAVCQTRVEELEALLAHMSRQGPREYVEPAVRRFARETETLAEVARIISSSLDIDEVYERFAREVGQGHILREDIHNRDRQGHGHLQVAVRVG